MQHNVFVRACMRASVLIQVGTFVAVLSLLFIARNFQPRASSSPWVAATEVARLAASTDYTALALDATRSAGAMALDAYSAASAVTEAASEALGLQSEPTPREDPNALALIGFHAADSRLRQAQAKAGHASVHSTTDPPPQPPLPPPSTATSPPPTTSPPARAAGLSPAAELPRWLTPIGSALLFNAPARSALSGLAPKGTTLHFTFGSAVMMDFVKNWLHFVSRAGLTPYLVGASDVPLLSFCDNASVAAAGINPELDVWTHERRPVKPNGTAAYELKSGWKYYRHHNSDFLEMGLVKVAFLRELVSAGFDVLISDLDVVWLNGHWKRWMTWRDLTEPPVAEAALIARVDILVTTDELSIDADVRGGRPHELNTGVIYFRAGAGALKMLEAWRSSMTRQRGRRDLTENVNDQMLFNGIVRGSDVTASHLASLEQHLSSIGRKLPYPLAEVQRRTRRVFQARDFTFGTLPIRPFASGHTWFNQNVQQMAGHELPQHEPVTVHFTFQFGDTQQYPHGKRQRAREAALWAVDPPEYFTEGIYVALVGPTYTAEQQAEVYRRFPEWSPQRHMFMDAPQRQAVRDLLGLATALDGVMVMPKLWCHCDRYWGFLSRARIPLGLQGMPLPFGCPMDALFDTVRWNNKNLKFREHTFLNNSLVPAVLRDNRVRLSVAAPGETSPPSTAHHVTVAHGTPLADVREALRAASPGARVVEVEAPHLRRLCRWLGSRESNRQFNKLMRYVLTESSRYCPNEDHGGYGAPGFNWQNPFTAYNCTWGFRAPVDYPETDAPPCGAGGAGVAMAERSNSTTCPRQMLCDWNVMPDGTEVPKTGITRCNIEGYGGMDKKYLGATQHMLSQMPEGRCPYPPGDRAGQGAGFNSRGHWVGTR